MTLLLTSWDYKMAKKNDTLKGRMIRVEVLLNNHLKHHELWFKSVIGPMAIGVILILVKLYFF